jgi:hypothetical protein
MDTVLAILKHDESSHHLMSPSDVAYHMEQEHGMDYSKHPLPITLDTAVRYLETHGIDIDDDMGAHELINYALHEMLHEIHEETGQDVLSMKIERVKDE